MRHRSESVFSSCSILRLPNLHNLRDLRTMKKSSMNYHGIEISKDEIAEFCRKWEVRELSLFGSVLRDDFGPNSDVDVLVSLADDAPWSLFEWIDMIDELKVIMGRPVDLVEKSGLRNPFRRHEILTHRRVIYAA